MLILIISTNYLKTGFLMDMVDATKETGLGLGAVLFTGNLIIYVSGDIFQPQFRVARSKGTRSFEGGDFSAQVNNRFMLRRSRVHIDFVRFGNEPNPGEQIVFQSFLPHEKKYPVSLINRNIAILK